MMKLAKVFDDIVLEYITDESAWDSDFLLKCTQDEIFAYALHFHGLAPTFGVALDWVYQYSPFSIGDDDHFGDLFTNEVLSHTSAAVQAHMFAHMCVSIYAQAVVGGVR